MYDLVIVGSGPAGLTAAIYAARYTLNTLVIGSSPGGQVAESGRIENYPGFKEVVGFDLTQKMIGQVEGFGVVIAREEVSSIKHQVSNGESGVGGFKVSAGEKTCESRAVILAVGVEPRKLGVSGEEELTGRGVSYCALCDAPFYKGKVVAMVGGGDSAVDGALELAEHAKKIYLINRSNKFRAKPDFVEQAKENSKIEFILETNVTQIGGESCVDSITLDKPYGGQDQLSVGGVFIEIGNVPNPGLLTSLGLEIDGCGYIKVAEDMSTNVPGVFAAGDITGGSNNMKQIVTACAEGAIAAQSVYRYLGDSPTAPRVRASESRTGKTFEVSADPASKVEEAVGDGGFASLKKKLIVSKDLCIGCGLCVTIAENTFELGGDGKARVKDSADDPKEKVQEAIDSCPTSAISLV